MRKMYPFIVAMFFAAQLSAVGVGDQAPDFTLTSLEGNSISLSDFSGDVVYIFWFGNG